VVETGLEGWGSAPQAREFSQQEWDSQDVAWAENKTDVQIELQTISEKRDIFSRFLSLLSIFFDKPVVSITVFLVLGALGAAIYGVLWSGDSSPELSDAAMPFAEENPSSKDSGKGQTEQAGGLPFEIKIPEETPAPKTQKKPFSVPKPELSPSLHPPIPVPPKTKLKRKPVIPAPGKESTTTDQGGKTSSEKSPKDAVVVPVSMPAEGTISYLVDGVQKPRQVFIPREQKVAATSGTYGKGEEGGCWSLAYGGAHRSEYCAAPSGEVRVATRSVPGLRTNMVCTQGAILIPAPGDKQRSWDTVCIVSWGNKERVLNGQTVIEEIEIGEGGATAVPVWHVTMTLSAGGDTWVEEIWMRKADSVVLRQKTDVRNEAGSFVAEWKLPPVKAPDQSVA